MKSWKDFQYVQIAGNHKTGTSLLSALLDDHPDIASYAGQTSASGALYPILNDPNTSKTEKVAAIVQERFTKETDGYVPVEVCNLHDVAKRLKQLVNESDNTFANIHFAILRAFYDEFDPERLDRSHIWLDKSPLSHLFADELFATFPETKFIHLLRDPKDNFASVGGSFLKKKHSRVKREALLWRYRVWSAQSFYFAKRNQQKFGPDRYMVLRFRDLCLEPKRIIPEIAAFIGIPVLDILYQPSRAGYFYPGNNKEGQKFEGIFAGNVDRWMERIPEYYAKVMECQSAELLDEYGYPPYFDEQQRAAAFRPHRFITALTPRSTLTHKYHANLFRRPAVDVPGI